MTIRTYILNVPAAWPLNEQTTEADIVLGKWSLSFRGRIKDNLVMVNGRVAVELTREGDGVTDEDYRAVGAALRAAYQANLLQMEQTIRDGITPR